MRNIWEFLLYTLTCSMAALFLLVVKRIMADKLSPRWQYGAWVVLAVRCLVPIGVGTSVLLPLPLWIETLKSICERSLNSVYSAEFQPIAETFMLPLIKGVPASITDWVFAVYVLGVAASLMRHIVAYVRLRIMLKNGSDVPEATRESIVSVAEKYGLKSCRAVSVRGLKSAFVCGCFRPVLAVPEGIKPDEKIILHELMHLKYYDALQSILWCILRALHWCNPFMHYVFDRVSNDMESLCDQRVLERLEGEERREYGVILLEMANEKYARAPGTTSISNGGKNIARRIEAIVRFKKYPRGMALVSVCILVFAANVVLSGSSYSVTQQDFMPIRENELHRAMATARIYRCGTVAGALDTYAKGLIMENGVYLAAASPLDVHKDLTMQMRQSCDDGWVAYHVETGAELDNADKSSGYMIYNLEEKSDGSCSGFIAVNTYGKYNEEEEIVETGTVLIPVTVTHENGWVVRETGERQVFEKAFEPTLMPPVNVFKAQGQYGSVSIGKITEYEIENTGSGGWNSEYFDETPKLNAAFSYVMIWNRHEYDMNTKTVEAFPETYAGFEVIALDSSGEKYEFTDISAGSGATSGYNSWSTEWVGNIRDGIIKNGGGGGWGGVGAEPVKLPAAYAVQIVWDGERVEEFLMTEEAK